MATVGKNAIIDRVHILNSIFYLRVQPSNSMEKIIDSLVAALEKLLNVVNTPQRFVIFAFLVGMISWSYLGYYLMANPSLITQYIPPPATGSTIVRVGGKGCYQRLLVRPQNLFFIGIQFPLSEDMERSSVTQNVTGLILEKNIGNAEFLRLCDVLVDDIESSNRQDFILNLSKDGKRKLIEYYRGLDAPTLKPLTKETLLK